MQKFVYIIIGAIAVLMLIYFNDGIGDFLIAIGEQVKHIPNK